jgi:hypothetical protein
VRGIVDAASHVQQAATELETALAILRVAEMKN